MANTYTLISSVTVGSGGAANIQLASIPSTYTDLVLVTSLRDNAGSFSANITFNNSTSSYSNRYLRGDGSTTSSSTGSITTYLQSFSVGSSFTANTFSSNYIYIPNYAGSNNKSVSIDMVTENNSTTSYAQINAGLWSNTSAITEIDITTGDGSFVQYSTAYLYGISNA
jgi:hypothetical protein